MRNLGEYILKKIQKKYIYIKECKPFYFLTYLCNIYVSVGCDNISSTCSINFCPYCALTVGGRGEMICVAAARSSLLALPFIIYFFSEPITWRGHFVKKDRLLHSGAFCVINHLYTHYTDIRYKHMDVCLYIQIQS